MKDFSKCKIYKLVLKGTDELGDMYVGSTVRSLAERLASHRSDARCGKKPKVLQWMRDVGIENVDIILLEEFPDCQNFDQQRQREREWADRMKPSLNQLRAYVDREERLELTRQYYEQNRDVIRYRQHLYCTQNRNAIREMNRRHREQNREKRREKDRIYRANKRKELSDVERGEQRERDRLYAAKKRAAKRGRGTQPV